MIRCLSWFRLRTSVAAWIIIGSLVTGGCRVEEGANGVGFSNPYGDDDVTYFPPDPMLSGSDDAKAEPSGVDP